MPGGSVAASNAKPAPLFSPELSQPPGVAVNPVPANLLGLDQGESLLVPSMLNQAVILGQRGDRGRIADDLEESPQAVIDETAQLTRLALLAENNAEPELIGEGASDVAKIDRDLGPYTPKDCYEFRARHFESAKEVVQAIRDQLQDSSTDPLTEDQLRDLQSIADQLRDLSSEAAKGNLSGASEASQVNPLNQIAELKAKLIGGTHDTKYGWVRCLFSRNARRARTIQRQAERGNNFSSVYIGNKVKNIHPKAALALYLRGRLKRCGLGDLDATSTPNLSKALGARYLNLTQRSEAWSIYEKTLSSGMTCKLTPAAALPVLKDDYEKDKLLGVSSMNSKEKKHAVNLWKTEFNPAAPSQGISFKGFRHGVLDAYGIRDETLREEANKAKATELVRAAASEMRLKLKQSKPGEWTMPMVSVSLQTGGTGGDGVQIDHQEKALNALAQDGVRMPGPAPDGTAGEWVVKPDCLQFFIGVNQGALTYLSRHWPAYREQNEEAIKALLTRATDEVDRLNNQLADPVLKQRASLISELRQQIEALQSNRDYQKLDADPYKLPPRILLLAHLLDNVACFNCKSGKDRTGMVDIEVKALVESINRNIAKPDPDSGEPMVPQYGAQRNTQAKKDFAELHVWGGSQHVSRANTGLMGNKSDIGTYLGDNLDRQTVLMVSGFARHADGNKA